MLDVTRLRVLDALARLDSVTAAANELRCSQSTVSHHLARLEAETGVQLLQRAGRRIRLTPAGQLLATRAAEIIGRIDAADNELATYAGLATGRVRVAGFSSVIGSLIPRAIALLARSHPRLDISLANTQPPEAIELLRLGKIDVAIIFRYGDTAPEPDDIRLRHLLDDPLYVLSRQPGQTLASLRQATWIAGCDRCRAHLVALCAEAGFEPDIGYSSDNVVVMQALVAAGLGVTTSPGLALRAHRIEGIEATEIPGAGQRIYAASYGDPPDPPATTALIDALAEAASSSEEALHLESGARPVGDRLLNSE
jgi:DNA-binding transcriptional LysR family regulator